MNLSDIARFKRLLKGVSTIDIISFGSVISPEYLINLICNASWNGRYNEKFGFIGASLPGNGWHGGFNSLLLGHHVDWVVGGFFGTVNHINPALGENSVEVHNIPQGVASCLLSGEQRKLLTTIGKNTFIDPDNNGSLINNDYSAEKLSIVESSGEQLCYTLPDSDLVLLRGSGFTPDGNIVLETEPIDLDIEQCIKSARLRKARIAIQLPDKVIKHYSSFCYRNLFDEVFIAPSSLHGISYLPNRYHHYCGNLSRTCLVSESISYQLADRISNGEKLIVGIGLPVPAINHIKRREEDKTFTAYIESGVEGEIIYDGEGFGICKNGRKVFSQAAMFKSIWNGDIDHAVLGIGEIDKGGNVNVSHLGGKFYGVGGFIDISQSINKISFCFRKKTALERLSHISFRVDDEKDVEYLVG
ncbi:hypothetical protein [Photorhabdus viridis]|uniref:hypothetical protein n=1 Tax=Photorhabdus viridis TaxID=3163327 RepID=UPI0033078EC3